ncbi:hypothetical protein SAMN04488109_1748 [Chryseolinea serpens]|uniref:Uncharacterized protein n=1 Tax=Chryseolinea serpens TaxID=947013 RepID=A0A1M5MHE4_9BACT|nr:hypothetical protein SAMN04488109_1748 [Chryseolinea serpens]
MRIMPYTSITSSMSKGVMVNLSRNRLIVLRNKVVTEKRNEVVNDLGISILAGEFVGTYSVHGVILRRG